MAGARKHLRSSTADKRPTAAIEDGQLAVNTNATSPGLFFKDSTGATIIKVGPVHVGTTAPNAVPAAGGSSGNSTGEVWLDTSLTPLGVKIWNGATWANATPAGSTTVQGLLELATNAETQAGSDATRAVTPSSLQSKLSDSTSTASSTTIASSAAVKSAYDLANAALPKTGGTMTGQILADDSASASTPGYAFDGDPNTGVLRTGADALALVTGGTARLTISDAGLVVIPGDLTVNGATTTVNTQNLIVKDKNIQLASVETPTDITADGGGITIKGATDKTLNWANATDSFTSSENVDLASGKTYKINGTDVLSATALGSAVQISSDNIPAGTVTNDDLAGSIADSKLNTISTAGKVSNSATTATSANTASAIVARDASGNFTAGTITAALSGNASTSSKLQTARTITLAGDLSGSANFDGSANVTLTATVADDSHNHIIGNVDGLQSALNAKAPLASPALTGTPTAPTAATATNTTQVATTAYVTNKVAAMSIALTGDVSGSANSNSSGNISISAVVADNSHNHSAANITSGTLDVARLLAPVTGNWWRGVGLISSGGVMEVGKYIDFHLTNTATTDYDARLEVTGTGALTLSGQRMFADNYHPNADKWTNARTLSLTGVVAGSASFDGSGNISLATTLNGGPLGGMRNLLINGNPIVNQRSYVSGTATSGANQYTLDRWRVVTSGQSITWTDSNNVRTVTAPAGGVEQVIEGLSIISGTYTLSWTGTATATVNGTAVAKGGQVTLTGGSNATVRFSGGTFSLAQLEVGTVATPFERRSHGQELALCQRYYQYFINIWMDGTRRAVGGVTGRAVSPTIYLAVPFRATPTATTASRTIYKNDGTTYNPSQVSLYRLSTKHVAVVYDAGADANFLEQADWVMESNFTASAEL